MLPRHIASRALVNQSQHALLDKAAGLVAQNRPIDTDLLAPSCNCIRTENDGPDRFIIVLHGVDKGKLQLIKIVRD